MMQNDETDPSYMRNPMPNPVDRNNQNYEFPNANQKSAPLMLCNPPKKQNSPTGTMRPHQNWSANLPEYYGAAPTNRSRSLRDHTPNVGQIDYNVSTGHHQGHHYNMPQMQSHRTSYQMTQQIPPQIAHQASTSPHVPMQMPFNSFNPFGIPFPIIKYGQPPTTEAQYPYSQYPSNRVQAMQNVLPPTFQMNQNPFPAIPHTHPNSSLAFTESEPSRRYNPPNSSPMYSQPPTAVRTLFALTDTPGLKRRTDVGGDASAFHVYKKQRLIPSTGSDTTVSTSPHSTKSNDGETDGASSTVKDDHQVDGKKKVYPLHVVDENDDFTCIICQENKKNTVLLPCRHLCVCEKCADTVALCPLCREDIPEILTVFT